MLDMIDVPLDITQEMIDQLTECPIALAARAAMPGAMITTSALRLWIDAPGLHTAIDLPWDVRNTIDALSHGYAITPCVLTLPIPREVAELPGFLADETLLSPLEVEACGL